MTALRLAAGLLCVMGAGVAQEPASALHTPSAEIRFGASFELRALRSWPAGQSAIAWDDAALQPLQLRLLDVQQTERNGTVTETRRFAAYAFTREALRLLAPAFTVRDPASGAERQVRGAALELRILPALAADAALEPELFGDVAELPRPWWHWPAAVFAAALATWLGVRLVRRWRRQTKVALARPPAATEPGPATKALARLAALRSREPRTTEATQEFYVEASALVREYIEARFALRAPEMTTEEFLANAAQLQQLHRELLAGFLSRCDLVKFARFVPDRSERERLLQAAASFVTETTGSAA